MTVWELILELTRYDPYDEVTVEVTNDNAVDVYDVREDRVTRTPIIVVR